MIHLVHLVRDHCVSDPWRLLGIVVGNLWIASCYIRIPRTLRRIVKRCGGSILSGHIIRKSAAFVLACGITHVFGVATLFLSRLDDVAIAWMFLTAIISEVTSRTLALHEEQIVSSVIDARSLRFKLSTIESQR